MLSTQGQLTVLHPPEIVAIFLLCRRAEKVLSTLAVYLQASMGMVWTWWDGLVAWCRFAATVFGMSSRDIRICNYRLAR